MAVKKIPKVDIVFGNYSATQILINGHDVALPFGFETSTRWSQVRLCDGVTKNAQINDIFSEVQGNKLKAQAFFGLKGGALSVEFYETKSSSRLERNCDILFEKDSEVFDLVQRFRFRKEMVKCVNIAGERLVHTGSNKNHMHITDKVQLEMAGELDGCTIEISRGGEDDEFFDHFFYARDFRDEWIIHYRLVPKKPYNEVVMINHKISDEPLPDIISSLLLKIPSVRNFLWYKGERAPKSLLGRLPLNAYACKAVPQGTRISLSTTLKVF